MCCEVPVFWGGIEPVVHPKGHIMARTEDLFFRSAVVREGAVVGDSQALEVGCRNPRADARASPRRSLWLCWIAPSLRAVSTAPARRGNGPFSKVVATAALLCDRSTSAPPGTWDPWSGCLLCLVRTAEGSLGAASFGGVTWAQFVFAINTHRDAGCFYVMW